MDPYEDVEWVRTNPVFIMNKQIKTGCKPSRNYENGSSSINFEFPAPGDYYKLDRQTVRCKGTHSVKSGMCKLLTG